MAEKKHRYDSEKCGHGCDECGVPHDTGRIYICDSCGERLDEKNTAESAYPHWHDQPKMIEWAEGIRKERGEPEEPIKRYHRRHAYRQYGGTSHLYLCGPMHLETEQEYFVHWTGGSMKHESGRR